jgi:hypothetical protein
MAPNAMATYEHVVVAFAAVGILAFVFGRSLCGVPFIMFALAIPVLGHRKPPTRPDATEGDSPAQIRSDNASS